MNYLSISTIIKKEHRYLREWVEFYVNQGVDHFYLYDNSDDELEHKIHRDKVCDFEKYITWNRLPGRAMQRVSCNHTILNYGEETEWCLFCDVDEFLYSGKDKQFVGTLNREYDKEPIAALAVHWLLFGSNGHLDYKDEPVTKRFTRRAEGTNPHVKSIVRLKDCYSMGNNVHTFRVKGMIVDENFQELGNEYAISSPATSEIFRMNHYVTKSKEECRVRRGMPRSDTGEMRSDDFFEVHDCNEVEDKRILEVL